MRISALTTLTLAVLLALPAGALADPRSNGDTRNAAKECKAERGNTDATRQAFAERYGTNANNRNAFGKCVSQKAREEHAERHAARRSAQRDCRTEREELGPQAFAEKYGTNRNRRNAFGKCVSSAAKKNKLRADREDARRISERKSAAEQCREERDQTGRAAFEEKYGTNHNRRNAFGKCVSKTVRST